MSLFPYSYGRKYILLVIEYFFKWLESQIFLINDAKVIYKFFKKLFFKFEFSRALISDRGTHFCNSQLKKFLRR